MSVLQERVTRSPSVMRTERPWSSLLAVTVLEDPSAGNDITDITALIPIRRRMAIENSLFQQLINFCYIFDLQT